MPFSVLKPSWRDSVEHRISSAVCSYNLKFFSMCLCVYHYNTEESENGKCTSINILVKNQARVVARQKKANTPKIFKKSAEWNLCESYSYRKLSRVASAPFTVSRRNTFFSVDHRHLKTFSERETSVGEEPLANLRVSHGVKEWWMNEGRNRVCSVFRKPRRTEATYYRRSWMIPGPVSES